MPWSRRRFLAGAALTPLAGVAQVHSADAVSRIGGRAFGSSWRISVAGGVDIQPVRQLAERIVGQVDVTMSPYRADSALSRFNATQSTNWQAMPGAMCAVVGASLRIAQFSGGAFDPAVGPMVGRYGFGPIRREPAGYYEDISVHDQAVRKSNPGLCLDLCAIAKGYALDRIADGMAGLRINNFLIELGGEVRASGRHPNGRSWQAGIERPTKGPTLIQRIIRLDSMALATSADSASFYEIAGRRFCHIIDPRSGQPIDNGLSSVSVIAMDAMTADGLATALMVLGPERGVALARTAQISALFIQRRRTQFHETMTGDFANQIVA